MNARFFFAALFALGTLAGCKAVDPLAMHRTELTRRPLGELTAVPAFSVDALAAQYEGEPAYFFDVDRTVEHVFLVAESGDWSYVEDLRQSYVVLDPEEERYTTFRATLAAREFLDGVFLRTTSPTGEVRTYTEADMVREVKDGETTLKFAYPSVERGTVIEESFRTSRMWSDDFFPPLYIEEPLQREVPVGRFAFRYIYPDTWALKIKSIGPRQIPPYELDRNSFFNRTAVTFVGNDLPAFPDEPYAPYFKETAPYLEMQVSKILHPLDRLAPPMYEAPETWQQVAERYGEFAFDRGGRRYREVEEQARELTAGAATDSAKTAQIVSWIQNNVEVESGPEDIAGVLRERKGDRFMVTALAQAMLGEAEVESDFILIHPVSDGYFDRAFVTGNQFYVPAVRVALGSEKTVVFPYIEGLATSYIPEEYQGADAMLIRKEGLADFITVPSREADAYAIDDDYDVEIDEDGVIRVRETKTLRGIAAYLTRRAFADLTDDEREEEARELLTYNEGEIQDFEYDLGAMKDFGQPLEITLRYTIPDLVTVTPEEVIFRTGGLLSPASLRSFETDLRDRQLPIRIHYDQVTNKTISIRYPETWTLATQLEDTAERNRFGDVRGVYTLGEGEITAEQQVTLKETRAAPNSYRSLLELTGSESKLYVPTLVFTVER